MFVVNDIFTGTYKIARFRLFIVRGNKIKYRIVSYRIRVYLYAFSVRRSFKF